MTLSSRPSAPAVPIRLGVNTPHRFYRGGGKILAFRGLEVPGGFDGYRPEDWLASTTRLFAEGGDGQTVLPDGTDLASALEADPDGWLGPDHVAAFGREPNILTKLLDAGERLPVHSHPDRTFAARHLDCAHGKTEAWIVLDADPGAAVWLGFREDLAADTLAELVEAQDDRLLEALNRIEVSRGDTVLVPAGQPHAIGEGVFVLEIQEPTDLSVMLEHARFGLEEAHAFLGLPRPVALDSVDQHRLGPERIAELRRTWAGVDGTASALPEEAGEFFRAEVVTATGAAPVVVPEGFAVTVVVAGSGSLTAGRSDSAESGPGEHREPRAHGESGPANSVRIRSGDVLLVPHATGPLRLEGDVTLIRCLPPLPAQAPTTPTDQSSGPRVAQPSTDAREA
jgi:mannose-6-phosphate isomerase